MELSVVVLEHSGYRDFKPLSTRIAKVMEQCRELVHLNLNGKRITPSTDQGTEFLFELSRCTVLTRLHVSYNSICDAATEILARCTAIKYFNLSGNPFRPTGNPRGSRVTERLESSWGLGFRESSGLVLEEENSWEEDEGDEEENEDEDDEDEEDEDDEHDFGDIVE